MPTEKKAEATPSIATGHELNAATWTDYFQRLRHDCGGVDVGAGVSDHCTANAIFIV